MCRLFDACALGPPTNRDTQLWHKLNHRDIKYLAL